MKNAEVLFTAKKGPKFNNLQSDILNEINLPSAFFLLWGTSHQHDNEVAHVSNVPSEDNFD